MRFVSQYVALIGKTFVSYDPSPRAVIAEVVVVFQYYGQPEEYEYVMDILNIIFTSLFTLECLLKLFAFNVKVSNLACVAK